MAKALLPVARELQATSKEARSVLADLKRLKRGFTWRMMGWAVAASLVTNLPLIGWFGLLAWTNHKQAEKWNEKAATPSTTRPEPPTKPSSQSDHVQTKRTEKRKENGIDRMGE